MGRLKSVLLVLLLAACTCSAAESEFNVDCSVGWGGVYRPTRWTPVQISIAADKLTEAFGGTVMLSADQDDINRMTVSRQFVLTPDVPARMILSAKIASHAGEVSLKIYDSQGRRRWSGDVDFALSGRNFVEAVTEDRILIGQVGRSSFHLGRLAQFCSSDNQGDMVHVLSRLARLLPYDWTGYDTLDVLVLYDVDWDSLTSHQCKAIEQWVRRGGKLLMVLGARPMAADHVLRKLLPVDVGMLKERTIRKSFGKGIRNRNKIAYCNLTPKEGAIITDKITDRGDLLFVVGLAGFGRVGVLGFDPSTLKGYSGVRVKADVAAGFWIKRIESVLGPQAPSKMKVKDEKDTSNNYGGGFRGGRYYGQTSPREAESSNICGYLMDIEAMEPISMGWIVLILVVLAVLLGPVDYLVLKRLDRQPLTWITSTLCVLLFTAVAYYGVEWLRAGDSQLRIVTMLDGVAATGETCTTTYAGIFAPHNDNYELQGTDAKQWWAAIAPSAGWQSFGSVVSQDVLYRQHDGASIPLPIPIGIWSMQCMTSETHGEKMPISAKIIGRDPSSVRVIITNNADSEISMACVILATGELISVGSIAPGKSVEASGTHGFTNKEKSGWLALPRRGGSEPSYGGSTEANPTKAIGCDARTRAIDEYRRMGAAEVIVRYENAPTPLSVAGYDHETSHIKLVRLIVFPEKG